MFNMHIKSAKRLKSNLMSFHIYVALVMQRSEALKYNIIEWSFVCRATQTKK